MRLDRSARIDYDLDVTQPRCARMLKAVLALCLVCLACAADDRASHHQQLLGAKANPRSSFWQWVQQHEKSYSNDLKEFEKRFRTWMDNLDFVLEHNAKQSSYWLGLNSLADLSHEEYKQRYLGYNRYIRNNPGNRPSSFMYGNLSAATLPAEVDWRATGAVSEVKNQQQCGSCWAFSTTGAVEGINAVVTNSLTSLSEQELVDCDRSRDNGCNGGLMDFAFEFIHKNGGIDTEDDYPYLGAEGACNRAKKNRKVVTIDGYEDVPPYDEVALKKAVSKQPVSVAIEADQREFQLYMGGVFDNENCGVQLDHGVLAVGYGIQKKPNNDGGDASKPHNYWIVKNSWGPEWGDKGFIKMRMGLGKAGLCGIAIQPSYPIKHTPNPPMPPPTPAPGPDPEPDAPVSCDSVSECPAGTTCCCVQDLAGFCFSWGCCPMVDAVCCADKQHCCPHDLPVCDTVAGRCLPQQGSGSVKSAPWSSKTPAHFKSIAGLFKRQSAKKQPSPIVAQT